MAFYCQTDSYATELPAEVVSCTPAQLLPDTGGGRKETLSGYNVTLSDTVLFPEGGGQPDDRGTIGDTPVLRVTRRGPEALHFVTSPLEPGARVLVTVDWRRRFDHMQQHSAQHLITAVADSLYGYKTTSWELGRHRSTIELDVAAVTAQEVDAMEEEANRLIRRRVPVTVRIIGAGDPEFGEVRSRGLPEDHAGPVRIIHMEGVDSNMCCGTHVANLSELQAVKILGAEKGKKNKTLLLFLAGDRLLRYAAERHAAERSLTALLKTAPEQHVEAVDRLQRSVRSLQKDKLRLLRDLAVLIARDFRDRPHRAKLLSLHRQEGDSEFMNIIANEVGTEDAVVFLTVGEEKEAGLFLLAGPPTIIDPLGPQVCKILDGKGAGKAGRFQGKANKMSQRGEAETLVREAVSAKGEE